MNSGKVHFVIGGSRSGKSKVAEELASKSKDKVHYVATCRTQGLDDEMKDRIVRHQNQRPSHWTTIENCFDLVEIATRCEGQTILMDCLTLWLANEMCETSVDQTLETLKAGLLEMIKKNINCIIVSNELGMGVVPIGAETRAYRDLVGWANQQVSDIADTVIWTVAGIPVTLKKNGKRRDLS